MKKPKWLLSDVPELAPLPPASYPAPPDYEQCRLLWQKYGMLPNIVRHSRLVAHIASTLAEWGRQKNIAIDVAATRAAGLLHDIAKTWCIRHGGSHAYIGASWIAQETGNLAISQGVLLHVNWPWPLPHGSGICSLPLLVIYGDKRIRHDRCVTIDERFEDLFERYGKTRAAIENIKATFIQTQKLEKDLSQILGRELHENTFDCGRLVDGA